MLDSGNRPVVVLTALDVEYEAVRALMIDVRQRRHPAGTLFEVGRLREGVSAVVIGLTGPGNAPAAVIAERAITEFHPRALLFVGVAGGLQPDIQLGDVVVGTKIYSYHGGRDEDEGFLARPRAWEAPHELDQLARHVNRSRARQGSVPTVHFKPIAAGEVVLNSRNTPLADQLHRNYNDAAAIEMESAGISQAGHLNRALSVLTIRGISDHADGNKHHADDEGWQQVAAEHAADFAIALVVDLLARQAGVDRTWSHVSQRPGSEVSRGLDWVALERPVDVMWRRTGRLESRSVLQLHVVPVSRMNRIEVRRLVKLSAELTELGRHHSLFGESEQLRAEYFAEGVTVQSQAGLYNASTGLEVRYSGQLSAWVPFTWTIGSLTELVHFLLAVLAGIDVPAADRVVLAIALGHHNPTRVEPEVSLSYEQLVNRRADVAEELAAWLEAELRGTK